MVWNLVGEWLSLAIIIVISLYSIRSSYAFSIRDRIFNISLCVILFSILCTLASTYMLYSYDTLPLWLVTGTTTLYFAMTPLISVVYFYYTAAVLRYSQNARGIHPIWLFCCFPYLLYLAMVLTNPWHNLIYTIQPATGYTQGSAILITYLIFYVYCLGCLFLTLLMHHRVERRVTAILLVFPLIAFIFIFLQKFFPTIILTGSASVISALILYLYLQSTRLSVDPLTGLLNRSVFLKAATMVIQADKPACVVVVSLNDFKNINAHFGQTIGDVLLRQLACFLKTTLEDIPVYRTSGDRFTFILTEKDLPRTEALIHTIHGRLEHTWHTHNVECRLSASIAIADIAYAEGSLETAIRSTEYALAECKKNPEMVCCRYEPHLRAAENRRAAVKNALEDALAKDGFQILYQPIWSVGAQRFTQAEALLSLPFDAIKLDKGLVWTVMGNPVKEHFIRHLVHGFLALDRHVVAEGVETQEQLDYISQCGCDLIQGYFFSKPLKPEDCLGFLEGR